MNVLLNSHNSHILFFPFSPLCSQLCPLAGSSHSHTTAATVPSISCTDDNAKRKRRDCFFLCLCFSEQRKISQNSSSWLPFISHWPELALRTISPGIYW